MEDVALLTDCKLYAGVGIRPNPDLLDQLRVTAGDKWNAMLMGKP